MVMACIPSMASAMRRPASAVWRRDRRPGSGASSRPGSRPKPVTSAPAENARPRPAMTTTFTSGRSSNQAAAPASSSSVRVPSGLSLSGRLSQMWPSPPSALSSMVSGSNSMAGHIRGGVSRQVAGPERGGRGQGEGGGDGGQEDASSDRRSPRDVGRLPARHEHDDVTEQEPSAPPHQRTPEDLLEHDDVSEPGAEGSRG